ncbi:hypothetical protein CONLIGDRAFT_686780 [Coniochaeta ligniaria NRRL 30616]|uniref:Uncharacterized protein n=1 Tax=Coniochaeta ligniaria NRRL 30616 TaxID=1408157 RepID=A0A1J7J0E1_9PEZI|nr:hypothetical protein CONLIGDRAFT_686780 [Coniochaeta ligniaria NRRL 30616]
MTSQSNQLPADGDKPNSTPPSIITPSPDQRWEKLEPLIDKVIDLYHTSTAQSDECMKLIREYPYNKTNNREVLANIFKSMLDWIDLDGPFMKAVKALHAAVEEVLKPVPGQEPFKFPAGLGDELNNDIFVNKSKINGPYYHDLQYFWDHCEELTPAAYISTGRQALWTCSMHHELLLFTGPMTRKMAENSD